MRHESYPAPSQASPDAVIRLAGWITGAVGVGGYVFWAAAGGLVREGNWVGVDFRVYYQAAQVLSRGGDIYGAGISPPYVYPPLLAALIVPLTALSQTDAIIFWKLLQHVCLVAAGVLLIKMAPARIRPLVGGLLLLGWLTVAVQDEIRVGESNSLVLLLIVGALWLVARGEEEKQGAGEAEADGNRSQHRLTKEQGVWTLGILGAGGLLALAVSIKVLPVLLIGYFWWRGPRTVAAAATGGFVALQLLSLAITPATTRYWLVEFPGLFGQAFPYPDNQSLNAFFARALLPGDESGLPPVQLADGALVRPIITWVANALVVAAAIWVLWRSRRGVTLLQASERQVRLLLEVGLVLLTTHLVSGSTWLHHLVQLAVPVTGLLGAWWLAQGPGAGNQRSGIGTASLATIIGVGIALLLHRPYDWAFVVAAVAPGNSLLALLASSMAMWVVVGLWAAVAVALVRGVKRET
jgi:hypothetical protein